VGGRGALVKKGIQPKNHAKENRDSLKNLQEQNR
jgi:hypothetical protein